MTGEKNISHWGQVLYFDISVFVGLTTFPT
jgi:hypothetical protein